VAGSGTSRATERQVGTIWESYRSLIGGLVMVQEQNMKLTGMFLEGAFKGYTNLLRAPVPSPGNGVAADSGVSTDLPIGDYDRLNVEEVIGGLEELSAGEVEKVKAYEKNNKNRATLIERFDRSLV
jgi:hypothetical protein